MAKVFEEEKLCVKVVENPEKVFEEGKLKVVPVEPPENSKPPKPLLIFTPTEKGKYPVVVFFHGFCLTNSCYSAILTHVASHGYIAVAPQLYTIWEKDTIRNLISADNEDKAASEVLNWLPNHLQYSLKSSLGNDNVEADISKLAIAGHSRGGRAAFYTALHKCDIKLTFSLLMGIDPVAGCCKEFQLCPRILTNSCFNMGGIPVLVVGTGLGDKMNCVVPACAPKGVNHEEFYKRCQSPRFHLVATEYGHMDMLNDEIPTSVGKIARCMCKTGEKKECMRKFVGGIMVAFMKSYLKGDSKDHEAILAKPSIAPVKLYPVEYDEK